MISKLAAPWSTRPSTTTGDAMICANGGRVGLDVPLDRARSPVEAVAACGRSTTKTASPATAAAATTKPPTFVAHCSVAGHRRRRRAPCPSSRRSTRRRRQRPASPSRRRAVDRPVWFRCPTVVRRDRGLVRVAASVREVVPVERPVDRVRIARPPAGAVVVVAGGRALSSSSPDELHDATRRTTTPATANRPSRRCASAPNPPNSVWANSVLGHSVSATRPNGTCSVRYSRREPVRKDGKRDTRPAHVNGSGRGQRRYPCDVAHPCDDASVRSMT